ncbi:hypothetical protein GW922_00505 [Candidatus Pacearchaeota archaeon]|nr:hypothetical protein [Candidatus Pacearchaeota archaeon]PIN71362.1 MAG: hypothetical protein COV77_02425 [Candidatus Pacearchaeota archaeon CG11_big_fil_rev_8_21_14_0_20_30_13]PIZ82124.1 MAG: hypothetical protein COX98_01060 [Candidatus Pacearchaeota archaeon CG_4_10_14_0_2_um_filter_30_11]PJA71440.1 MAG: hypothetical protein CO153_01495 [Candidatus Pacearchaeota archaeon CG_4_9_14_3_um_filter_30_11]
MPILNSNLSKKWIRAFFDCEGWVYCKTHQNRSIGLDSVNEKGIDQIINSLNKFGIKVKKRKIKNRNIFRILIYGKDNLVKFKKEVGFFHPDKKKKLNKTIEDYVKTLWSFPKGKLKRKRFVRDLLIQKIRIKKPLYLRIISKEKQNLEEVKKSLFNYYNILSKIKKQKNGRGFIYYEISINKRDYVEKLIKEKIVSDFIKRK